MSLSYNQIIKKNKAFVNAHYLLEGFGNGFFYDVILSNKVATFKYPLMFMEDQPSSFSEGVETFTYRIHFMNLVTDLKNQSDDQISTNLNEVKSDMRQCAKDFLAFWVKDSNNSELEIVKTTTLTYFEDETEDSLTGCYIDITFRQRFTYNKCAIPASAVGSDLSECPDADITVNSTTFGSATSGGTLDIPVHNTAGTDVGTVNPGVKVTIEDVEYTDSDGSSQTAVYGTTVTCTPSTPQPDIYYNIPYLTQTTSYHDYDEAYRRINGGNDYNDNRPANSKVQELKPDIANNRFDYLRFNNKHGHKFRYYGENGGYYDESNGNYYDVNGNLSDKATEFPALGATTDYWVYDGLTGWRIPNREFGASDWTTTLDRAGSGFWSFGGGNPVFLVPTKEEALMFNNDNNQDGALNNQTNRPFFNDYTTISWTCTTRSDSTTNGLIYYQQLFSGIVWTSAKTTAQKNLFIQQFETGTV